MYKGKELTVERGIEIQTEQLIKWEKVLKPEIYSSLVKHVTKDNHKAVNGYQICRGSDMDIMVNWMGSGNLPII